MSTSELLDPFERLLADTVSPQAVRALEAGGASDAMWASFEDSGYLDALVPETAGGAGLSLADVAPLLMALGAHAVPLPVAETMLARALMAAAGKQAPVGPAVLITQHVGWPVSDGRHARWALAEQDGKVFAAHVALQEPTGLFRDLSARITLADPTDVLPQAPPAGLRGLAAVLRSAAIAGAAARLLAMTVGYANDRVQFGKPIGKLQAVQQQLAVMAELTIAARLAAQLGCAAGLTVSEQAAATAKYGASAAAADIAAIAHAVHGAIGISAEYDLQLLTRRLHQWRLADGSDQYWAQRMGALRHNSEGSTLDFIRA